MTDSYTMESNVDIRICESHVKKRAIKFLYIVEFIGFYGLSPYNKAGWLELRN